MGLDDLDNLDGNEGGTEGGNEQSSEKTREKASKKLAGIQRTKKDEKKAQRDDDVLHICLRDIITSRRYDTLIPSIFPLFDIGIPSHIIIGAFSLIYQQASNIIRDNYLKEGAEKTHRNFHFPAYSTPLEFDDETLDPLIRKRINEWIEDIFTIIAHDPSVVMTDRFIDILSSKDKKHLTKLLAEILIFFLISLNIHINESRASLYTEFILKEVEKKLKKLHLERI